MLDVCYCSPEIKTVECNADGFKTESSPGYSETPPSSY